MSEENYVLTFAGEDMLAVPDAAYVSMLWLMETKTHFVVSVLFCASDGYKLSVAVKREGADIARRTWTPYLEENTEYAAMCSANTLVEEMNNVFGADIERIEVSGDTRKLAETIAQLKLGAHGLEILA